MLRLSVIIPTLNEIYVLPGLLEALSAQTRPPDEIIVADAGSKDGTAELARARGLTVVPGGRPGPGRNAGARAATGDLLLFLDADVLPPPNFIAGMLAGFARSGADVATSLIAPIGGNLTHKIITEVINLYLQAVQSFSPHAPGFCILARRELHETIGGFDETVKLAEDFDYVQRAAQRGVFEVLTHVRLPVSLRRLEEEGLTRLAFKHLWGEMYALAGKPMHWVPYEYELGAHPPPGAAAASRPMIDIAQLREQLGRFENPIQRLSAAGLTRIENLIHQEWVDSTRERFRLVLDPPDRDLLRRYLRRRLALFRRETWPLEQRPWRLDFKRPHTRADDDKPAEADEKKSA